MYNQLDCFMLDQLVEAAEQNDIYLMLCLFTRDLYSCSDSLTITLRDDNTQVVVLLAQLIPTSSGEVNELIEELNQELTTLAEELSANGYRTAAIVTNPFVGKVEAGLRRGFRRWTWVDHATTQPLAGAGVAGCGGKCGTVDAFLDLGVGGVSGTDEHGDAVAAAQLVVAQAHGLRVTLQSLLRRLDDRLMLPAFDASILALAPLHPVIHVHESDVHFGRQLIRSGIDDGRTALDVFAAELRARQIIFGHVHDIRRSPREEDQLAVILPYHDVVDRKQWLEVVAEG